MCCPLPVSPGKVVIANAIEVNFGPQLGDINRQSDEPPLLDQGDLVSTRNQREEDADRVTSGQHMNEEEIVFLVDFAVGAGQYGGGHLLALAELVDGVFDLPRIPVVEESGFVLSEDDLYIVVAWMSEEPVESLVRSNLA